MKKDHDTLNFEKYTLKIKEEEKLIISEIKSKVESKLAEIYKEFSSKYINNIYFDRHIYQPLLAECYNIGITPAGLNPGEKTFIMDLKKYIVSNPQLFEDKEVFILRNLPRRGIGFFEIHYFYPDFIIWIKSKDKQHLLFVDPKGLCHMLEGLNNKKIQLFRKIKSVEKELTKKRGAHNIFLDSFIISISSYQEIRKIFKNKLRNNLEQNHVLFQKDDKDHYIEKLMDVALSA